MSLDDVMSVSLTTDQIQALCGLLKETDAFAVDVAPDLYRSLRVVTFHPAPVDFEDAECRVRFWTVSVAGTIREQASEPEIGIAA